MKKFWKALGITAALAALVPVSIEEDKETGKKTYRSLLLSLDVKTDEAAKEKEIGLNLADGLLVNAIGDAVTARQEAELFTDDPDEAVLFAGGQPEDAAPTETAVVTEDAADEAQDAAPEGEASAPVIKEFEDEALH